jgi:DNA-binding transcriptional MocR family regulator
MAAMATVSHIGARSLARLLPDLRALPGPTYSALARAVESLVMDGRIALETRLPSERELAAELAVSRATITAAYDALRSHGYLLSRTGAGSFVAVPAGTRPRASGARWSAPETTADVIDLSRATLPAPPAVVAAAAARAPERLAGQLLGDGYEPHGLPGLREAIASRFTVRGVATRPEQVFVTNGALHGLDLLLRLLLEPGDRVITELPSYPGALDAIRANRGRAVSVPMRAEGGWQIGQLTATMRQAAPRLAFLVPDFHNPTGVLMNEADRREVLRAARRNGTTVIIDESFVELGFADTTGTRAAERACAAIDPSVITVGSLSKPVWGGLRIGWIRASAELVARLAALRASIDLGGSIIDQVIATDLVSRLDEIAAARVTELAARRDALLAALAEHFPQWAVRPPQGGLSLWAELDAPMSTALAVLAAQVGVVLVPGSRFGVEGTLERFLRLPFTLPADRLTEAVSRLASARRQLDSDRLATRQLVVA